MSEPTGRHSVRCDEYGLVVAAHRTQVVITAGDDRTVVCGAPRDRETAVVGDSIEWHPDGSGGGIIVKILPRVTSLTRSTPKGVAKIVAANLDRVLIVFAPRPRFSPRLIDRHLVVAEHASITPILVLNKLDALDQAAREHARQSLSDYVRIGYELHETSTKTGAGIAELKRALTGHRSILVGQSGVGKSSITRLLTGNDRIAVGGTSRKGGMGRHTTSASSLYPLDGGGHIVDTPGAHDFGLWHVPPQQLEHCFVELRPLLGQCRFRDCQHLSEPECAFEQALKDGRLSAARLDSYRQLRGENA